MVEGQYAFRFIRSYVDMKYGCVLMYSRGVTGLSAFTTSALLCSLRIHSSNLVVFFKVSFEKSQQTTTKKHLYYKFARERILLLPCLH